MKNKKMKCSIAFIMLFAAWSISPVYAQLINTGFTIVPGLPPGVLVTDSSLSGEVFIDTAFSSGGGGSGTVTSVGFTGHQGITISGTNPVTTSGTGIFGIANGSLGDSLMATTYLKASSNLFDLTSASTARTNLGLGSLAVLSSVDLSTSFASGTLASARFPALTGDVTNSAGAVATTVGAIQNKSITLATGYLKYSGSAFSFDNSTFLTANQTITLTGDVSGSGATSITTTIGNDRVLTANILNSNVTLAKLANIADQTILGNNSGGSAAPIALTASQTKTVLSLNNVENTALSTWAGTTNITTLGTIGTGTWAGTTVAINHGGTGQTTANDALNALLPSQTANSGKVLTSDGTNTSWAASAGASTTTAMLDLSSPSAYGVKDTLINSGNGTLIHVTTEPTIPQFYYVIRAADIPTSTVPQDFQVVLTIGGKNRNTTLARTINGKPCRGTNPATTWGGSFSFSCATSTLFWAFGGFFTATKISVGDTIGFKMWGSLADTIDFRYATFYFLPRLITPSAGQFFYYTLGASSNTPMDFSTSLVGANAGVTYSTSAFASSPSRLIIDSLAGATQVALNLGSNTGAQPNFQLFLGQGQYLTFSGSFTALQDVITGGNVFAVATLPGFPVPNLTGGRIKYLRKWTIH